MSCSYFSFKALYFAYGFGAFVSPLIAEPFLSGTPHPDLGLSGVRRERPLPYGGAGHRHHHHVDHLKHLKKPTLSLSDELYDELDSSTSQVQFAYWIIALAHVSWWLYFHHSGILQIIKMKRKEILKKGAHHLERPSPILNLRDNLCPD